MGQSLADKNEWATVASTQQRWPDLIEPKLYNRKHSDKSKHTRSEVGAQWELCRTRPIAQPNDCPNLNTNDLCPAMMQTSTQTLKFSSAHWMLSIIWCPLLSCLKISGLASLLELFSRKKLNVIELLQSHLSWASLRCYCHYLHGRYPSCWTEIALHSEIQKKIR